MVVLLMVVASCGGADARSGADDRPLVVVTTSILGDVVSMIAGDVFDVVTVIPNGADPHDFQPSAQQVAQIEEADALITNGADFEEGLIDVIESAQESGVPVLEVISTIPAVDLLDNDEDHDNDGDHDDEDHDDEDHDGEEHDDGDHDHGGVDPHFFTDPARMAQAVDGIADFVIATVEGVDEDAVRSAAVDYVAELQALDAEVEAMLAGIPAEGRVLVTNHDVFGYFAERHGFEVVGAILPAGTTTGGAAARQLVELAELIEAEQVPAVFTDSSASSELADALASEVGGVAGIGRVTVVELYSESLGPAGSEASTYVDMVRTNAERIASALAG